MLLGDLVGNYAMRCASLCLLAFSMTHGNDAWRWSKLYFPNNCVLLGVIILSLGSFFPYMNLLMPLASTTVMVLITHLLSFLETKPISFGASYYLFFLTDLHSSLSNNFFLNPLRTIFLTSLCITLFEMHVATLSLCSLTH